MSDTEKKEVKQYIVKDTDGLFDLIMADNWECDGNGLKFYMGGVKVAHYTRWVSYKLLSV